MPTGWTVSPLRVEQLPHQIEVPEQGVSFGRDPSNSVALLPSAYPGVSSRHARLEFVDGEVILEDLESKNGTFVSGEQITRRPLRHGEVFELGEGGPRFAVMNQAHANETIEIPPIGDFTGAIDGNETMDLMREKLGISGEAEVDEMLKRRSRKGLLVGTFALLLLVGGGTASFWLLRKEAQEERESLKTELTAALEQVGATVEEQRVRWEERSRDFDEARSAWERDKEKLEEQRARIEEQIQQLAADEAEAEDQLAELHSQLSQTNDALSRFNPLEVEKMRLTQVGRVESAVVMIEARRLYVHGETGEPMYIDTDEYRRITPNFDRKGTPLSAESTGSGFAIGKDGYILTNAHVVYKKNDDTSSIRVSSEFDLVPKLELDVVFSRTAERYPAQLIDWASSGDDDLAVIKIEPFEGMPYLDSVDLESRLPSYGSEVYLLGFPLGKKVLQEGEKVSASTFKGIVSRSVEPFFQVDAAVHPGNSGGPVISGEGKILGIVTAMHVADPSATSSSIGYIIPIRYANSVWPPVP